MTIVSAKSEPGRVTSTRLASCLPHFGPAFSDESQVAHRSPGERRPVTGIDRNRLLEQSQGFDNPLFRYWKEDRNRAKIEIVGGEIIRRTRSRAHGFGGLQCRFDYAGHAEGETAATALSALFCT
jgi:hypothetical protein